VESDRGSIRNVAGNNTITNNIALAAAALNTFDVVKGFKANTAFQAAGSTIRVDAGKLTTFGAIGGTVVTDLWKLGAGELELNGLSNNTYTGSTRIKEGTLTLNKVPGLTAAQNAASTIFVGDNNADGTATLNIAASDQILDATTIQIGSTGS